MQTINQYILVFCYVFLPSAILRCKVSNAANQHNLRKGEKLTSYLKDMVFKIKSILFLKAKYFIFCQKFFLGHQQCTFRLPFESTQDPNIKSRKPCFFKQKEWFLGLLNITVTYNADSSLVSIFYHSHCAQIYEFFFPHLRFQLFSFCCCFCYNFLFTSYSNYFFPFSSTLTLFNIFVDIIC